MAHGVKSRHLLHQTAAISILCQWESFEAKFAQRTDRQLKRLSSMVILDRYHKTACTYLLAAARMKREI